MKRFLVRCNGKSKNRMHSKGMTESFFFFFVWTYLLKIKTNYKIISQVIRNGLVYKIHRNYRIWNECKNLLGQISIIASDETSITPSKRNEFFEHLYGVKIAIDFRFSNWLCEWWEPCNGKSSKYRLNALPTWFFHPAGFLFFQLFNTLQCKTIFFS